MNHFGIGEIDSITGLMCHKRWSIVRNVEARDTCYCGYHKNRKSASLKFRKILEARDKANRAVALDILLYQSYI